MFVSHMVQLECHYGIRSQKPYHAWFLWPGFHMGTLTGPPGVAGVCVVKCSVTAESSPWFPHVWGATSPAVGLLATTIRPNDNQNKNHIPTITPVVRVVIAVAVSPILTVVITITITTTLTATVLPRNHDSNDSEHGRIREKSLDPHKCLLVLAGVLTLETGHGSVYRMRRKGGEGGRAGRVSQSRGSEAFLLRRIPPQSSFIVLLQRCSTKYLEHTSDPDFDLYYPYFPCTHRGKGCR